MMKQLKDYLHLYIGCELAKKDLPDSFKEGARKANVLDGETRDYFLKSGNSGWLPILRPLSSMTQAEMFKVADLEGYQLDTIFEGEELKNKIHSAKFFPKGTPHPQDVFDPIENDCIGFETSMFYGVKEGDNEIWGDPQWDTFWDWDATLEKETWLYLLSKHFDLFGLIEAGLAIDSTTLKPA